MPLRPIAPAVRPLRLADLEEARSKQRQRLSSSLVYPAFVLSVCLIFLVVAPGLMLSTQANLLRDLNVELPVLSQALIALSQFASGPFTWIALAGLGLVLWRRPSLRARLGHFIKRLALRWKPIRNIWTTLFTAQWAQMLAVQVQAGLPISDSLKLAAQSTEDPDLAKSCSQLHEHLVEGAELNVCLRRQGFPTLLVEMVKVGEESGQLAEMLVWSANFYEQRFQGSLETLMSMLEPLVMLILGVVTGATMLTVMLPMVKALQSL